MILLRSEVSDCRAPVKSNPESSKSKLAICFDSGCLNTNPTLDLLILRQAETDCTTPPLALFLCAHGAEESYPELVIIGLSWFARASFF